MAFLLIGAFGAAAQQITVTGTVIDNNDETLTGVNVVVKGTTRGVVTDIDGKFTINVPSESAVLQISFVGYASQEIPVGSQRVFNVTLTESANTLSDVVVIGYGSQMRANLTGAVGSVSGITLERIPVASAAEALSGKVAGVVVTTADGEPGSEINIRIRGGTSITQSNKPLYIVDGFPAANIDDIPPTDIMSIDILKDASLTAIYGARGGNGVVVVTTKAAKAGKMTVSFNHTTQVRMLARPIDMLDPYEYVKLQYEANNSIAGGNRDYYKFLRNFGSQYDWDQYKNDKGNDWQDMILGSNPMSYMYNFTIGGGSEQIKFNSSITHNDEKGVLQGSGVMRTNINTKINIDVAPNLRVLLNPRLNFRRNTGAGAGDVGSGGIVDVLRFRPTDGTREYAFFNGIEQVLNPLEEESFAFDNPRDRITQNYKLENLNTFSNQVAIEWRPIEGLTLRSEGMQGMRYVDKNEFWGPLSSEGQKNLTLPLAQIETKKRNEYSWQNVATYSFAMDRNNFTLLAGQEITHAQERTYAQSARYFPKGVSAEQALQNMSMGETWKMPSSSISSPNRTASFFGQVAYDFDSKYLVQGTFRADASTRFAPENRWGYFPAVSAGWVVSKEDFMQNQDIVSFLKIRAGIGMTGNNDVDDDMWRYQYKLAGSSGPGWGESKPTGYDYYTNVGKDGAFPNTDIKWETAITRSLALDVSLFNDRVSITPEVYLNTVRDLLYLSNISTTTGYPKQMQNIAQVTSKGFELTVNGTILQKKDYYLKANFNVGFNRRTIDKLNGDETEMWFSHSKWESTYNDYGLRVGDDIGLIYGFVYDGLYSFDEFNRRPGNYDTYNYDPKNPDSHINMDAIFGSGSSVPGRPRFKNFTNFRAGEEDYNVINEHDRVVIGNTNPKATGGFGLNGGYGDFDFSCNFTFMYGFDVNNATRYELSSLQGNSGKFYNVTTEFSGDKRWRYVDDNGVRRGDESVRVYGTDFYTTINEGRTLWNPRDIDRKVTFDYFIEDGSFLRLQDITVGYTLPRELTRKFKVERLRAFFSGYNMFLWTKYTGYDPEVDVLSGLTPSMDYNKYPRSRNFVFGVNISF